MKKKLSSLLQRHSITNDQYNAIQIEHIIQNDSCHLVSLFKEHLILDECTDFLRRFYSKNQSILRLQKIYEYYIASSMLFPNYTALTEGKYIYKNIMKKQKIIDMMEALDEEKKLKGNKPPKTERVFDTKIYQSIAFEPDVSKIKEIFSLTNQLNDSFEDIEKFSQYLSDVVDNITLDKIKLDSNMNLTSFNYNQNSIVNNSKTSNLHYSNINQTTTTATTLNNTNNQKKVVMEKLNLKTKTSFNYIKHNKIKLSLNSDLKTTLNSAVKTKLNIQLTSFFKHKPLLSMPMIDTKQPNTQRKISSQRINTSREVKTKKANLVINHNYMQSMPSELNSYRSREKRKVNNHNLYEMFNISNRSNSNNTKYSTINSYANKKIDISSRTSKKINMNEKSKKYLNIYITNGWLSERKSGKKCFKIIH